MVDDYIRLSSEVASIKNFAREKFPHLENIDRRTPEDLEKAYDTFGPRN